MSIGKRIFLKRYLPDQSVVDGFNGIPASSVADVMERTCTLHPRIRLMSSPSSAAVAGVALTVKTRAGDNLVVHQALDMITPGDVLVVSNENDETRSLAGEIMMTQAFRMGAVAVIFDGPIRDSDAIGSMPYHVYATGSTPGGPYKFGPGEINVPISCGGVTVNPGDVVLCDSDGVTIIPARHAKDVLELAIPYKRKDEKMLEEATEGTADRSWVMKTLTEKGFDIIDDCFEG